MKKAIGLRASIAAAALAGGCLFAGSALAQSCTTDNWSSVENAANLGASGPADDQPRYVGSCSLAVDVSGAASYVEDTSPDAEASYKARFYVLTNDLDSSTDLVIFETDAFDVTVSGDGASPTFAAGGESVAGNAGWNSVEVHWDDTGTMAFVVNDNAPAAGSVAAGGSINFARMGNVSGTATGSLIFDDFESRRTEDIGRLLPGDADANGSISLLDALAVIDEVFPPGGAGTFSAAPGQPDCNEDGSVDLLDALCVIDIVFP